MPGRGGRKLGNGPLYGRAARVYNRVGGPRGCSSAGEHLLCKQGARGSTPLTSTTYPRFRRLSRPGIYSRSSQPHIVLMFAIGPLAPRRLSGWEAGGQKILHQPDGYLHG